MTSVTPENKAEKKQDRKPEKRTDKPEDRSRVRLDQPLELRRNVVGRTVGRRPVDHDRFGRFAEQFARFMGTARFLIYMTMFVLIWVAWNALAPHDLRFDDYPFIFLTLMLSLQASYAAPLILLAQNRQETRDRVVSEQDRSSAAKQQADMEFLARETASLRMALGEVATRDFLRSELRGLLAELDERATDPGSGEGDKVHGPQETDPSGSGS